MSEDDQLKRLMDKWESGFAPDPDLAYSIRARAAKERRRSRSPAATGPTGLADWLRGLLGRPGFALAFASLFVLVGLGGARLLDGVKAGADEVTVTYRLSIDPLYRMKAVAGVNGAKGRLLDSPRRDENEQVLLAGLGWLQGELNLSSRQFRRVSELHSNYEGAFDELFLDLLASHRQYRELDRQRMSDDVIDYLEFYELLETQKNLREESLKLTGELLQQVSDVITPEQRERYRRLLDHLYPRFSEKAKASRNV